MAGGIFDQPSVAGAKQVGGAVAQANLDISVDADHVLPAGGRVPVDESAGFILPEGYVRGLNLFGQLRVSGQGGLFDVGLAVVAGVHSVDAHVSSPPAPAGPDFFAGCKYRLMCGVGQHFNAWERFGQYLTGQ